MNAAGTTTVMLPAPVIPPGPDDWRLRAACRGQDPELWHPTRGGRAASYAYQAARRYCDRCPVALTCLETGLAGERDTDPFGMWGGLAPAERRDDAAVTAARYRLEARAQAAGDA